MTPVSRVFTFCHCCRMPPSPNITLSYLILSQYFNELHGGSVIGATTAKLCGDIEIKLNPAVPVRTHTSHRTQSVERGPHEHHEPHRQPNTTSPIAYTTSPIA
jgi:hypothetical protein